MHASKRRTGMQVIRQGIHSMRQAAYPGMRCKIIRDELGGGDSPREPTQKQARSIEAGVP